MSLRWQFTRDGRFQVPYKVEIYDTEYGGSAITLDTVGGNPVELTMGKQGADDLEKIKGSSIIVRLWGQTGDFDDLHTRDNERFLVKLYIDGNHEADFIPIPDTFTDYVTPGNYINEIKCANLSLFKQKQFDRSRYADDFGPIATVVSRLQVIEDIIGDLFTVDVIDGVVFKPDTISVGNPSLRNQFIQPTRLEGMNAYEALEELIPKGHQYRMTRGKLFIIPVTEASFVGYDVTTPTLYDDNFQSQNIGGRLSKSRKRLITHDGVRRTYNPLESGNIVPSGDFELEDFGNPALDPDGEAEALPVFWNTQFPTWFYDNGKVKVVSGGYAWVLPESVGTIFDVEHFQRWLTDSGEVVAGRRLKIEISYNYVSKNKLAYLPIQVQVGGNVFKAGPNPGTRQLSSPPSWESVSPSPDFLVVCRKDSNTQEFSVVTPPVPETGELHIEVGSPVVDRSYEPSLLPGSQYVEINSFSIKVVDENGDLLTEEDVLAGEEGQVYEYSEGFGDGFTEYHPGAIFDDTDVNTRGLIDAWKYEGEDENIDGSIIGTTHPLGELEARYLYTQLRRDRDRISGTADVYDFLALVDGMRVNYIQTDFRYGRSKIELVEIRDHDIPATIEDRKKKEEGEVGTHMPFPSDLFNYNQLEAVGELAEDIFDEERTSTLCELDVSIRVGADYWIINENELSREDRLLGIYPITPLPTGPAEEYGPGILSVPIEKQVINAPKGSLIFLAPGQKEIDDGVQEEWIGELDGNLDILNNEKLPELELELGVLEDQLEELNNVQLPALEAQLDQLNNVELPALESQLDDLNNVQLPALESQLDDLNNVQIPALEANLDNLNNVELPALQAELDDLNNVQLPALESDLDNLNNTVIPGINSNISTLDGYFDDPSTIPPTYSFFEGIVTNEVWATTGVFMTGWFEDIFTSTLMADRIVANHISSGSITTNKLAADAVTANKILAGEITTAELNTSQIVANNAFMESIVASTGFFNEFVANDGYVGNLVTKSTWANTITANNAYMEKIVASTGFFDEFTANNGYIGNLVTKTSWTDTITANNAYMGKIVASTGFFNEFIAQEGYVDELIANTAWLDEIFANNVNVTSTLTMATGGVITNTNGDYSIAPGGFFISADGQGVRFLDGGTLAADIGFSTGSNELQITSIGSGGPGDMFLDAGDDMRIRGSDSVLIESTFGGITIDADTSMTIKQNGTNVIQTTSTHANIGLGNRNVTLSVGVGDYLSFVGVASSNPGGGNRVWKDGSGFLRIT